MLPTSPRAVFISYAHKDNESPDPTKRWLYRFLEFLRPLIRQDDFTVCSDRDINFGDDWHREIQAHLNGARAAVLFVSPAFLASEYIANSELPVLLKSAGERGVKIVPVLVSPSMFLRARFKYPDPKAGPNEFTLASILSVNPPSKTLVDLTEGEQNRFFQDVAERLIEIVRENH